MEIREDFKMDPKSWEHEAKQLMKRSLHVIIPLCLILPFILAFLLDQIYGMIFGILGSGKVTGLICGFLATFVIGLMLAPAYYVMFFYKRVDFNEKVGIFSMFRDIKTIFSSYIDLVKWHKNFFFTVGGIFLVINILLYCAVFSSQEYGIKYMDSGMYERLSTSTIWVSLSLLWCFSVLRKQILGLVYMGYQMVNAEGAVMLTEQAYKKFQELEYYVTVKSGIYNLLFFGFIFVKMGVGFALNDPQFRSLFFSLMNIVYVGIGCYYLAIIYLISRDLYGGKPQKKTVEVKDDLKNMVPNNV